MESSLPLWKRKLGIVIAVVVVASLILNSGVAVAAPKYDDGGVTEECPASLVTLGEDLWEQLPELPSLEWTIGVPAKARLLWKSFLVLLESVFPGFSSLFSGLPDLDWLLSWLPASWFEDDNLTTVPVISQASGVVIGLVPVVGPLLDGTAIVTAKDQITGECISRMGQGVLLASAGATMVFPALLAVKGGLKVGKPLSTLLPEVPVGKISRKFSDLVEEAKGRVGWKVSRLAKVNQVAKPYRKMLRIVGDGATPSKELAEKMGLDDFTDNNYREGLKRLTEQSDEGVRGLEAHHILPKEFAEKFQKAGIENINDPRLLVWVEEAPHRQWSHDYSQAWDDFFNSNQNPTVEEILEEARELAKDFDYPVLFEMSDRWLPGWLRLPFLKD